MEYTKNYGMRMPQRTDPADPADINDLNYNTEKTDAEMARLEQDKATRNELEAHKSADPIDHPDGSVITAKLADSAVTDAKIGKRTIDNTTGLLTALFAAIGDVIKTISGTTSWNTAPVDNLAALSANQAVIETAISALQTAIDGIQQALTEKEHFRGYYATTAEIEGIVNPEIGDFAYNAETGTKWNYSANGWEDTGSPVPDQTTPLSDGMPVVNGVGKPGISNEASRSDHEHPTDPALLSTSSIVQSLVEPSVKTILSTLALANYLSAQGYGDMRQEDYDMNGDGVVNEADVAGEIKAVEY